MVNTEIRLIIFFVAKEKKKKEKFYRRSFIQSAKKRPGVDCGSHHELSIARFRLKLKKVGKTTRPFRYAAAAAANSLQSFLTLCDPTDSSPPGSPSLGFSRQEHWSGLPLPSPMHESEKSK